ncbi:MAG: hypothetical protein JNN01_26730 [Opitutaceae bacterium]|nr:hypothetical protein [Opitutaceae bacterium]
MGKTTDHRVAARTFGPPRSSRVVPGLDAQQGPLVLRSRGHQLADYLGALIDRRQLVEPLPGGRLWSLQLGVSRRVLDEALQLLQRRGQVTIGKRGVRLVPRSATRSATERGKTRRVRALLFAGYRGQHPGDTFVRLQERLRLRGVEVRPETCSARRLREIASRPPIAGDVFVLASVPSVFQRLFADAGLPALVLGEAAPGVSLPFINVDQAGAVRHATFGLLQRGITEISLVTLDVDSVGVNSSLRSFQTACAEWSLRPVMPTLFSTSLEPTELRAVAGRLASGIRRRRGVVVVAPVPIGMIVSALLHHGVGLPQRAEVAALFHPPEALSLYPPITYYRSPVARVVRQVTQAALQFFETGRLPGLNLTLEAERVPPRRDAPG